MQLFFISLQMEILTDWRIYRSRLADWKTNRLRERERERGQFRKWGVKDETLIRWERKLERERGWSEGGWSQRVVFIAKDVERGGKRIKTCIDKSWHKSILGQASSYLSPRQLISPSFLFFFLSFFHSLSTFWSVSLRLICSLIPWVPPFSLHSNLDPFAQADFPLVVVLLSLSLRLEKSTKC